MKEIAFIQMMNEKIQLIRLSLIKNIIYIFLINILLPSFSCFSQTQNFDSALIIKKEIERKNNKCQIDISYPQIKLNILKKSVSNEEKNEIKRKEALINNLLKEQFEIDSNKIDEICQRETDYHSYYEINYNQDGILSLSQNIDEYHDGANYPWNTYNNLNINLNTGNIYLLSDFLIKDYRKKIKEILLHKIDSLNRLGITFSPNNLERDIENFHLSKRGFTFYVVGEASVMRSQELTIGFPLINEYINPKGKLKKYKSLKK